MPGPVAIPKIILNVAKVFGGLWKKISGFGSEALGKASKLFKNFKGKDVQDDITQIKEPPKELNDTPIEDALEHAPETPAEVESEKLSDVLNQKAETRATHSDLLRVLGSNLDASVNKLNISNSGSTADLVKEYTSDKEEPRSAISALDNTGKILDNQVQMGEVLQMNSRTLSEIARTQADSDMTEALANRMNAMQEALKDEMTRSQDMLGQQQSQEFASNKTLMQKMASGIKGTMGLLQGAASAKDKAQAIHEALKELVYNFGKDIGSLYEAIKLLFDKIPFLRWIKEKTAVLLGHVRRFLTPIVQKAWPYVQKTFPYIKKGIDFIKGLPKIIIGGAVAAIKKIIPFGKSKEEREKEKAAKLEAKEAKKAAKAAKKAEKEQQKAMKKEAKEAKKAAKAAKKNQKKDADIAKEEGVEPANVSGEGFSEPAAVADIGGDEGSSPDVGGGEDEPEDDSGDEEAEEAEVEDDVEAEVIDAVDDESTPIDDGGSTAEIIEDTVAQTPQVQSSKPEWDTQGLRGMPSEMRQNVLLQRKAAVASGKFGMSREQALDWLTSGKIEAKGGKLVINQAQVPNATLAADSSKFSSYADVQREMSARERAASQDRDDKIDQAIASNGSSTPSSISNNSTNMNIINQPKENPPSRYDQNLPT